MMRPAAENRLCKGSAPSSWLHPVSLMFSGYNKEVFGQSKFEISEKWVTAANVKPGVCSGFYYDRLEVRFIQL